MSLTIVLSASAEASAYLALGFGSYVVGAYVEAFSHNKIPSSVTQITFLLVTLPPTFLFFDSLWKTHF
jgi:hypothetical protein